MQCHIGPHYTVRDDWLQWLDATTARLVKDCTKMTENSKVTPTCRLITTPTTHSHGISSMKRYTGLALMDQKSTFHTPCTPGQRHSPVLTYNKYNCQLFSKRLETSVMVSVQLYPAWILSLYIIVISNKPTVNTDTINCSQTDWDWPHHIHRPLTHDSSMFLFIKAITTARCNDTVKTETTWQLC